MKKVLLVAAAVMFALCSCGKTDLTEQIPQLKGSWQWRQTIVGGFVGVINPDVEKEFVLTFGDDNRLSISLNGEIVVSGETYSCKKTNGNEYGDYVISLPMEIRSKVANSLGLPEGNVVIDGYIRFEANLINDESVCLVITDVKGENMGVEGGDDFHRYSAFVPAALY